MQDCYRKSYLFYCPIVFKKKLLPLSLGHIAFLDLIASPFFTNSDKLFRDYLHLAYFCSMSFADCMQKLNDFQQTLEEINEWGKTINVLDKEELLTGIKTLNDYWKYYNDYPKRLLINESKNTIKVPVHLYIFYILSDRFNEQDIYDMPFSRAIALTTVHQHINNGDNSLMSEQDELMLEDFKNKKETGEIIEPVFNVSDLDKEI